MDIVSADFNNDGAADLAVLQFQQHREPAAEQRGRHVPAARVLRHWRLLDRPVSLAVGDLDGDGNIDDLAIANYGYGYGYGSFSALT